MSKPQRPMLCTQSSGDSTYPMRNPDLENSGGNERPRSTSEDTSANRVERKSIKTHIVNVLQFFGGGIYAPDSSTYDPIEILLNTEDADERDRLTETWRDSRLNELNFVGIVSALLAGVLTSTGSWPTILPNDKQSSWPVRASWYCGIILALFSLLSAADQTVRLHRMSSHRDGCHKLRKLLTHSKRSKSGRKKPSTAQIYTWQMPVLFLTTATITMIIGMFLHVWSATRRLDHTEWWNPDSMVAVVFTIVSVVSILIFFLGQTTLHTSSDDND